MSAPCSEDSWRVDVIDDKLSITNGPGRFPIRDAADALASRENDSDSTGYPVARNARAVAAEPGAPHRNTRWRTASGMPTSCYGPPRRSWRHAPAPLLLDQRLLDQRLGEAGRRRRRVVGRRIDPAGLVPCRRAIAALVDGLRRCAQRHPARRVRRLAPEDAFVQASCEDAAPPAALPARATPVPGLLIAPAPADWPACRPRPAACRGASAGCAGSAPPRRTCAGRCG